MTQLVTVWERFQKDPDTGEFNWEHNHIQNGWSEMSFPRGKFDYQTRDWRNGEWRKEWYFLMSDSRLLTRTQYCRRFLGKMY